MKWCLSDSLKLINTHIVRFSELPKMPPRKFIQIFLSSFSNIHPTQYSSLFIDFLCIDAHTTYPFKFLLWDYQRQQKFIHSSVFRRHDKAALSTQLTMKKLLFIPHEYGLHWTYGKVRWRGKILQIEMICHMRNIFWG